MRLHPGLYGVAILAMLTVASIAPGAEPPVGPALTPKLLASLREEMQLVLGASQDILAALVTGDHATVADGAQKITRSFILEQALTKQDLEDLEAAVPPAFLELDQAFHRTSAELAASAERRDASKAAALFGQMVQDCTMCHVRFAGDRFPGLASP